MTPVRKLALIGLVLGIIAFLALQIWASRAIVDSSRSSSAELQRRLATLDAAKLSQAKTQEEVIALRVENDRKAVFITTFVANLNAAIAVLVALIGAGVGLYQYLLIRRKERTDRAASELTELWKGITSKEREVRAGSLAGFQDYLQPERAEFHPRVSSALAVLGRLANDDEAVLTTYARVVESAMQKISPEIRRAVSWQGVKLLRANLRNLDLTGFDFRDAVLRDCDFTGSDLSGARFDAAHLEWTRFVDSKLRGASLRYSDLAGADLSNADLQDANLRHAKILGTNLSKANLIGASFRLDSLDWSLTRNWRQAILDLKLRDRLVARYGPEIRGTRILMVLWEYLPFVSGGGWTAAFHLLKSLRSLGADVTVLIPWAESDVSRSALGYEYDLLCAGIESASAANSAYGPYSAYVSHSAYSSYETAGATSFSARRSLGSMVAEFERRSVDLVEERKTLFDLIHAHDWLTFSAARRIAAERRVPWIAHFHSTEFDRRRQNPSPFITRVEREACESATTIVAVGTQLKNLLLTKYGVREAQVQVVPNSFSASPEEVDRIGDFDAQRVVFIGRLSEQKGPDHFVRIASELRKRRKRAKFAMFGAGDIERRVSALISKLDGRGFLSTELVKRTHYYWLFSEAEPVAIDPITGEWFGQGPLSDSDVRALAEFVQKSNFSVRPVQRADPYTHLITIFKGNEKSSKQLSEPNTQEANYLVCTTALPTYAALPNPFILMHDAVPWEERRRAYHGASLVIVPSRSEPFGLVVLEAMQFGIPVLYPETAGVAEVVFVWNPH
jgi:glycosyltransferase involved in cell wall biosynthesis/uncharacterized protein YjbI with pentapeptide repeats